MVVPCSTVAALLPPLPEPSLHAFMQVSPHTDATAVVVVGDTHGQYHDVCAM